MHVGKRSGTQLGNAKNKKGKVLIIEIEFLLKRALLREIWQTIFQVSPGISTNIATRGIYVSANAW